ncbi:glycosyl hydrolase [Westerdykella ornata]|uniref:Glycosyl hydrolase n=1 Tax=Westerdykella ornata TaxID=318751 RepID=A0A6A6JM53_WESOR|nr:glycosyl hydrolase [Westerdykella ornata]KAF2277671.1 glycosyl hydrolase [Westerdykella ornata]
MRTVGAGYLEHAKEAAAKLQSYWYDDSTGLWAQRWWESANMATTLAKLGLLGQDSHSFAIPILQTTFSKSPNLNGARGWKNTYYDDEGWWALAWLATFDLTGEHRYLDAAKDLFLDMTSGWTTPCGGGIWWDKNHFSIAAISNELFLSVAAQLANRVSDQELKNYFIGWAQVEFAWFSNSGIINGDNLVNDGIDQHSCQNDRKPTYTYNQGVILGGLAELAKATGNSTYLSFATRIARAAISKLSSPNGILTEPVDAIDEQGAMFKGAFVRGLAALQKEVHVNEFREYLMRNADSMWEKARDDGGHMGSDWEGKKQGFRGATSHASGLDVLVAAAEVV